MKLIVTGGTGFVATEIIRQGLQRKDITSLVVLSRSPLSLPKDAGDTTKLKRVAVADYTEYSDDVKKELAGANGCIWTVAITPGKAALQKWDLVVKTCQEAPLKGFQAIREAGPAKPFRFLYMSGAAVATDPAKTSRVIGAYGPMRGETEVQLNDAAKAHPEEDLQFSAARPGLITGRGTLGSYVLGALGQPFSIGVEDLCKAMIQQTLYGFESPALLNGDLKRLAKEVDTTKYYG